MRKPLDSSILPVFKIELVKQKMKNAMELKCRKSGASAPFFCVEDDIMMKSENRRTQMDTKIDFLYLSEPDMIKAGVKDMRACIESMEEMLLLLKKGD